MRAYVRVRVCAFVYVSMCVYVRVCTLLEGHVNALGVMPA